MIEVIPWDIIQLHDGKECWRIKIGQIEYRAIKGRKHHYPPEKQHWYEYNIFVFIDGKFDGPSHNVISLSSARRYIGNDYRNRYLTKKYERRLNRERLVK